MPNTSTILSLPLIQSSQAQKHVTMNEALRLLDVMVQTAVQDRTRILPPASPATGALHIVAAGAGGDWTGQTGRVALWEGTAWAFFVPLPGWRAYIVAEAAIATFDGAAWTTISDAPLVLSQLGVAASPDSTNKFAVSSPAILLNHAGAGHQVKINKAAATDTASLLFQSGFSGRAEMGIAGSDDFAVKVSATGGSFVTALQVNRSTGLVTMPAGAAVTGGTITGTAIATATLTGATLASPVANGTMTGTAVVQSASDVTAGRLLTTAPGQVQAFRRGNVLGTVTQSAGVPTGGLIEQGSNANGRYVRFADGTQICWHSLTGLPAATTAAGSLFIGTEATWTFPIAFTAAPDASGGVNTATPRWLNVRAASAATALVRVFSPVSDAALLAADLIAVGRWF